MLDPKTENPGHVGKTWRGAGDGLGQTDGEAKYTPPVRPQQCPRFSHCNAPICPLDDGCLAAVHLAGEPCCFYLLEIVKPGGFGRLTRSTAGELVKKVFGNVLALQSRHGALRRALTRASRTPPRSGRQIVDGERQRAGPRKENPPTKRGGRAGKKA